MKILLAALIYFFSLLILVAESKEEEINKNVNGTPSRAYLNINNISTQFVNNGDSDLKSDGNSGFIFPKESSKTAVFQSGFLWGAFIDNDPQVRVGGSAYRHALQPGKIKPDGTPENPELAKNRIYRVRSDVYQGGPIVDLTWEADDEGKTEQEVRDLYERDWNEWPAVDGAPFDDIDDNGIYDPTIDLPGVKGTAQTIWYVANDLDPGITTFLYGANPLGIEFQATIWAYKDQGFLDNLFFRKHVIINKSISNFDSMYVTMWSDPDIGESGNDYAGCDSLLSLGYCYNATDIDSNYLPLPTPAVGFDLIRGPIAAGNNGEDKNRNGIDDASDFGIIEDKRVGPGYINLPMSAFYFFIRGDSLITDPTMGASEGSTQFYNFMTGRVGGTGEPYIDPHTGVPTTFPLSGNPATGDGWVDGDVHQASDRRIGIASGPFNMTPGDTQVVVIAQIAAGAQIDVDRFMAIDSLKKYSELAQTFYDESFPVPVSVNNVELKPTEFSLSQNYPNPFNPSTTINFSLPQSSFVTLKIYDVLGKEVITLINEEKNSGKHFIEFDASNLSSGIYFYNLQASEFGESKKMLLMK
ncbi:MAG: T9SS type A sorting domain-containing protein [Ignavibacteriae bacterium]|nr:T9SS C-terminal target domain-containing protein [Ignavibacteriota bacterium]NOG97617.1 T9SS type A sorting domain-containing protein [Ignavibacteriota bacterium]